MLPLLMGWALFSILYKASKTFVRRREWYVIVLFAGCITSIGAILIHSLVDFNMQIGANGLYFFLLLALAVSAANTRMRSGLGASYLEKLRLNFRFPGILSVILFCAVTFVYGGAWFTKNDSFGLSHHCN